MVHVLQKMIPLQVYIFSKSILLGSITGFFNACNMPSLFEDVCFLGYLMTLYQRWLLRTAEWQK
jgi:hypothetical protein